ncbi:hypothetical protein [Leucobacter luti]|uniref:Uncharacterized protein n=1 Tax=Leucobacter luti TaxID=340320 RepID=A0A4Q7TG79_9MICO|nr:hypothetical protein [Leucobacter luti]MBL3699710.1 hypothetical protein [Leucobacter luti]RZT59486.1 hypothetical protein EV139_3158 [Leucobacter luti]
MSVELRVSAVRLERLRSDARLERETILERRVRGGEDPAVAVEEALEIDDFVVLALRDELLEESGRLAEFGLARLAARAGGPDAEAHRLNADRVEFELLRAIAAAVPELTVAVWRAGQHLTTD